MTDNPCGHSSHEYNPYAERHECCDSRYCRCTCEGAKEREMRYEMYRTNGSYADWLRAKEEKLGATIEEERSPSCQCSSSSPSALATSSSRDKLIFGVRGSFSRLGKHEAGMWLSREEIQALLGEPT